MEHNNQKKLTSILFIIYIFVLTWIILFKMQFTLKALPHLRGINLIPFAGSTIINGKLDFDEILNNVLVFIPFGLYLSMLKYNWSFLKKVINIACTSLLFEIMQFIFAIGATDITDLIGNTLGGVIGCILYIIFFKALKSKTNKILNILAIIGTIFVIGFLALLFFEI